MSYNAHIRRKKLKSGIDSLAFSIVRNWRDKAKNGAPNHETISYIKTVKEPALLNSTVRNSLWFLIDLEIHKLLKSGVISQMDKLNIEKRFAEVIPRPGLRAATMAITLPIVNSTIDADAAARLRERFKEFL
jgi:hypothetical protein